MGNENILTNQEKWNLLKKLLMEGKAFREIQRIGHVSPNFKSENCRILKKLPRE